MTRSMLTLVSATNGIQRRNTTPLQICQQTIINTVAVWSSDN